MGELIVVYIPSYNNREALARSLASCHGFDVVVSENCSDPEYVASLQDITCGAELIVQPENLGRLGNWQFCLDHFCKSGRTWMKWVFVGDVLADGASEMLERAITEYPVARMIVADYFIVDGSNSSRARALPETQLLQSPAALRLAASYGNWFGPPLGICLHRDALRDGFGLGDFQYAADMQLCVHLAERVPVLYLAEPIGEFRVAERQYYKQLAGTVQARVQEAFARLDAAERYERLTGDRAGAEELTQLVEQDIARRLVHSIYQQRSAQGLAHAVRELPLVTLLSLAVRRLATKLLGRNP